MVGLNYKNRRNPTTFRGGEGIVSLRVGLLVSALLTAAFLSSCIERSNPWDPHKGCPNIIIEELYEENTQYIDSVLNRMADLTKRSEDEDLLDSINELNADSETKNLHIKQSNDSILALNSYIDSLNRIRSENETPQLKSLLDTLTFYLFSEKEFGYKAIEAQFQDGSVYVEKLISDVNDKCLPNGVFPSFYVDSVFNKLDSLDSRISKMRASIEQHSYYLEKNSGFIADYNNNVHNLNIQILRYNDSILYDSRTRHEPTVRNDRELLEAINESSPGDTIVLDSGVYSVSLRFFNTGTEANPIVIIGAPLHRSVLDSSDVIISNRSHIQFYGLVFANSAVSGVKVEAHSRSIYFENCIFTSNRQYGIEVLESEVTLKNCKVLYNGWSGIRAQGNVISDYKLIGENVLVAHNGLHGINLVSQTLFFQRSTISDNRSQGVRIESANRQADFERCLFTFNGSYGIKRDENGSEQGTFTTQLSVFYGNEAGAFDAEASHIEHNVPYISHDPLFHDRQNGDFTVTAQDVLNLGAGFR
ncbi:right-handed parallel beta-helix repeat-containing protein [Chitinispirillales bacterium ANBcel5]|uniref:right-handed parallel beta-helix repeat-containing protein n=1 Tax=Cellulosispirillum alkaliphilum TaxID=3039283 RepID=UPI002A50E3BC|nr:right-handed parallel beta-helix repeat-containing protein [Chitinispirillales bacterium ANBcel5]